jgi:hypothetical protein
MAAINLRPAIAISGSVLAAAAVFAGLAQGATAVQPPGGQSFFMLLLPAALIGLFASAFLLIPLWRLVAGARSHARPLFALIGATFWLLLCAGLVARFGLELDGGAILLVLPGWVLIWTFGLLIDQPDSAYRVIRTDSPRAVSTPAGRAISPPDPAPAVSLMPGNARAGD